MPDLFALIQYEKYADTRATPSFTQCAAALHG